ncbi:MAG: tetratricopeptide repeat protein [Acetobacteraceae bacterium]|nr:tetratricopeptide repeat protein [Acetobacteraceae bacterium]
MEGHWERGNTLLHEGKLDQALAEFERVLALDPRHAPAHNRVGVVHAQRGDLAQARAWFEKALDIDPRYAPAHSNLGNVLYTEGRLEEAIQSYRRAIAIDPGYALAYHNLAAAYKKAGKIAQAIECLKKSQSLKRREWDQDLRRDLKRMRGKLGCALGALVILAFVVGGLAL